MPRVSGFLSSIDVTRVILVPKTFVAMMLALEAARRRRVMALHAQTLVAFDLPDEILPTRHGYPFKTRIPTKTRVQEPRIRYNRLCHQPAAEGVLD
jgi:hypothetical protein